MKLTLSHRKIGVLLAVTPSAMLLLLATAVAQSVDPPRQSTATHQPPQARSPADSSVPVSQYVCTRCRRTLGQGRDPRVDGPTRCPYCGASFSNGGQTRVDSPERSAGDIADELPRQTRQSEVADPRGPMSRADASASTGEATIWKIP